jgi:hypothetical protein
MRKYVLNTIPCSGREIFLDTILRPAVRPTHTQRVSGEKKPKYKTNHSNQGVPRCMVLYLHFPIHFHGIMLQYVDSSPIARCQSCRVRVRVLHLPVCL